MKICGIVRRYVHGGGSDEPVVWYEGSATSAPRYLHQDEKGSVIAASDSAGNGLGSVKYSPEGQSGALQSEFGYTGQLWIDPIKLYYYKARMYSPTIARFLQTDPIGYSGGMNLYAYAGNDPVNWADPMGLYTCSGISTPDDSVIYQYSCTNNDPAPPYLPAIWPDTAPALSPVPPIDLSKIPVPPPITFRFDPCETAAEAAEGLDSAVEAFAEKEADTLEKVSKATSLAGADGDVMARAAPKAFANEAGHLIGEFGESLSHRMTGVGAGLSVLEVAQSARNKDYPGAAYKAFDGVMDFSLSKLGIYGSLGGLVYDFSGGSKTIHRASVITSQTEQLNASLMSCGMSAGGPK